MITSDEIGMNTPEFTRFMEKAYKESGMAKAMNDLMLKFYEDGVDLRHARDYLTQQISIQSTIFMFGMNTILNNMPETPLPREEQIAIAAHTEWSKFNG